jgi:glutaredoxin
MSVYERLLKCCPYCGKIPEIADRSSPEFVDGDLTELDSAALERLRAEKKRIDGVCRIPQHLSFFARVSVQRKHQARQEAQKELRNNIAKWADTYTCSLDEKYRRFYLTFNIDILSAQLLGTKFALELSQKLIDFNNNQVYDVNYEKRIST